MQVGMALGATAATDLEELHRRALAEEDRVVLVADRDGELVGMADPVEDAALAREITLLWLTTHDGSDACAFYEAVG